MRRTVLLGLLAALVLAAGAAGAQTTLRIGLAEDPDVLDPTLARTFVGRIVFAGLCDKLDKARAAGVAVLTEAEFVALLEGAERT